MVLNKKFSFVAIFIFLIALYGGGCSPIVESWTDTTAMEEYGNKVAETLAELRTYMGESKANIKRNYGEPHEVEKRIGSKAVYNQRDRVEFDEIWEYCYSQGVIMINFERGCKYFFFKDGIVVTVDAG